MYAVTQSRIHVVCMYFTTRIFLFTQRYVETMCFRSIEYNSANVSMCKSHKLVEECLSIPSMPRTRTARRAYWITLIFKDSVYKCVLSTSINNYSLIRTYHTRFPWLPQPTNGEETKPSDHQWSSPPRADHGGKCAKQSSKLATTLTWNGRISVPRRLYLLRTWRLLPGRDI